MVCGKFVNTFAEASHALPDDISMDSDYPFRIPKIVRRTGDMVEIQDNGKVLTAKIQLLKGREVIRIQQSSSYERLFNKNPKWFVCLPFKDENTSAIGGV